MSGDYFAAMLRAIDDGVVTPVAMRHQRDVLARALEMLDGRIARIDARGNA